MSGPRLLRRPRGSGSRDAVTIRPDGLQVAAAADETLLRASARRVLGFVSPPSAAPPAAPDRSRSTDQQSSTDQQKGTGRWVPPVRLSASDTSTSG
jgi:hypothetical protein